MDPIALLLIIAFVLVAALGALSNAGARRRPTREQINAYYEAERQLNQAYLSESCGKVDLSESQFAAALHNARTARHPFQISTALYGVARMRLRKEDGKSAVPLIQEALKLEPEWPDPKPVFAQQMRADLERAQRMSS